MLKVGDRVEVEVRKVEPFGLFCRAGTEELLVLIPEISWIAPMTCSEFAEAGDTLTVKITIADSESGTIGATIRGLHPDPWEQGVLKVGSVHDTTVRKYVPEARKCDGQPGYLVEVVPGGFGMLPAAGLSLSAGQRCRVVLKDVMPESGAVVLALAEGGGESDAF